jgi:hypothetical protein
MTDLDLSKSILSAQYNNVATTPNNLAFLRGTGNYSSDYPLSSNWSSPEQTNRFDKEVFPQYGSKWNLSNLAPVGNFKPDQWNYVPDPDSFEGDPYLQFGLQSNHTTPTALNALFFNRKNVDYIQKRILQEIERLSGIKIKPQSESSLLIIMNNKYQYSLTGWLPSTSVVHLALPRGETECSLKQRLKKLNQAVIQDAVQQILSGMNMYAQYYKDASSLPVPLDRPKLTTMKGARVLAQNIGLTSSNSRGLDSFNMRYNII